MLQNCTVLTVCTKNSPLSNAEEKEGTQFPHTSAMSLCLNKYYLCLRSKTWGWLLCFISVRWV